MAEIVCIGPSGRLVVNGGNLSNNACGCPVCVNERRRRVEIMSRLVERGEDCFSGGLTVPQASLKIENQTESGLFFLVESKAMCRLKKLNRLY